jgi:hypothetical protein
MGLGMSALASLHARYSYGLDMRALQAICEPHQGYWPVAGSNGQFYPLQQVLDSIYQSLRVVPGIHAKKTGTWYGPSYDSAWIVQRTLDAWQLPYTLKEPDNVHHPRPYDAEAEVALIETITRDEHLRNWLVRPGGPFQLTPFQRYIIWFVMERGGGMWEVPPGGGKTVSATVFAELGPPGPVLHITKNSVTTQYARAIAQFSRVRPYELPSKSQAPIRNGVRVPLDELLTEYLDFCEYDETFETYANGRPHVVMGWDTLIHVLDALEKVKWSGIVFDESHFAKSHRRWDHVRKLHSSEKFPKRRSRTYAAYALSLTTPRRLVMTGTPQPDRRQDWWGQLSLCSNGWEETSGRYDKHYCGAQAGDFGWEVKGTENTDEFLTRKAFVVATVPQDVVDAQLPPRRLSVMRVSRKTQDKTDPFFRTEMRRLAREAGHGDRSARGLLAEVEGQEAAARKRSATIGLIEDYAGRRVALDKEAEERGELPTREDTEIKGKCVIFTGRHADCWELYDSLERAGSRAGNPLGRARLLCGVRALANTERQYRTTKDGKLVLENPSQRLRRIREGGFEVLEGHERQAMQDEYMADAGPTVLIATGQAWGTGLDLQDSDLLVIVYLPWSPGDLDQWMRRVQRLGMKRPCQVVILVADGTVDDRRASILIDKVPDIAKTTGNSSLAQVRDKVRGTDEASQEKLFEAIRESTSLVPDADEEMDLWESLL